jgi:uncharacterized membrane protein
MPEIIPLGWFHTVMGVAAILSGAYTLWAYKEITPQTRSGQIYLATTLVTAVTALGIYQHGFFGPGHVLAVMTLGALGIGTLAGATQLFGAFSRYLRALSYTATLLFHSIPAVTDGLLRLPTSDPVINSIDDPILRGTYMALLLAFLVGMTLQIRWIRWQQRRA